MEGAKLSHYWPFTKANLVLEKLDKNLVPLVGTKSQEFREIQFEGSPQLKVWPPLTLAGR